MKQTKRTRLVSCFLAIVMVLIMLSGMAVSSIAADLPTPPASSPQDARSSVVVVRVTLRDSKGNVMGYYPVDTNGNQEEYRVTAEQGTGFFFGPTDKNPEYLLTNYHVICSYLAYNSGDLVPDTDVRAHIDVYFDQKNSVEAYVEDYNKEQDFAILRLDKPTDQRIPLQFCIPDDSMVSTQVYTLGFPSISDNKDIASVSVWGLEDITVTSGTIGRLITVTGSGIRRIQTDAAISAGNSGGPLVNATGGVLGLNVSHIYGADTSYAVDIRDVMLRLDRNNIAYELQGSSTPASEDPSESVTDSALNTSALAKAIADAEKINSDEYTEDSYKNLTEALANAKAAMNSSSQNEIDNAAAGLEDAIAGLEQGTKFPLNPYVLIAVIVLIIVAVIILVVVLGKKKSKPQANTPVVAAPAPASTPAPAPKPAVQAKPVTPASSETTVLNQGAGETTVLSQGAGETTVLSQNINGGTLIRSGNNERIPICSNEFTIGRERNSVDYCVGGNTNISRVHARFIVRDGSTYIVDNKAANGTFVNGVKARAGQEIKLKDGDKILLADEKFEFKK